MWPTLFNSRRKVSRRSNCVSSDGPDGPLHRPDAVHLLQQRQVPHGPAPVRGPVRPDAHAGHQRLRVAVRDYRGGQARDCPHCPRGGAPINPGNRPPDGNR